MRQASQSNSARSDSWRNTGSGHSAHSDHDAWQNSWQSGDGINSEPGILFNNNPRFPRRQNSFGENSYGELQAQQEFHNSFGEFGAGGGGRGIGGSFGGPSSGGVANFHNSCVEFPSSSFGDNGNNGMMQQQHRQQQQLQPQFHNSFAGFDNTNNDFTMNNGDLHNSFGELQYGNLNNRSNHSDHVPLRAASHQQHHSGHGHHTGAPGYRNAANYSPNPDAQPQYALDAESVPLSISVPGEDGNRGRADSDFQLEFETDEFSGNRERTRGGGGGAPFNSQMAQQNPQQYQQQQQQNMQQMQMQQQQMQQLQMQQQQMQGNNNPMGLSIVDALENVGYSNAGGGNDDPLDPLDPFDLDPLPLDGMEPESIFQ